VIFGRHNVVNDAPISRIDLLVCRNLLIYLEARPRTSCCRACTTPWPATAILFLGKAETQLARSALFNPVEMKHRIFTKVPQEWRRPLGGAFGSGGGRSRSSRPRPIRGCSSGAQRGRHGLSGGRRNGAVALANVPAQRLLGRRRARYRPAVPGPADLLSPDRTARPDRRGVPPARGRSAWRSGISPHQTEVDAPDHRRAAAVLRPRRLGPTRCCCPSATPPGCHALQRELEAAQESLENSIEELQSANEELETTNEELQSTNEELETTNEELQSTNEELETLNEEARSSNEEMESVNEELRIQAEQASSYRLYLESVLRSDERRHHRHRPERDPELEPLEREHLGPARRGGDRHQLRRARHRPAGASPARSGRGRVQAAARSRPSRCSRAWTGAAGRSPAALGFRRCWTKRRRHGAVLLFQDITEERRNEDYRRYLGRVMDRALGEVCFLDPDTLAFKQVNEAAQRGLGYSQAQLAKMSLLELIEAPTTERGSGRGSTP
jgi:two-component system CheB/CheR fusion protein